MHIGGVLVFEGPTPEFADYLDHVRGRLHSVPRYQQKLRRHRSRRAGGLWASRSARRRRFCSLV